MQQSGQIKRQIRLVDAAPELSLGDGYRPELPPQVPGELVSIVWPTVAQGSLQHSPYPLIRIQLRRIRREVFDVKAGEPAQELTDRFAPVCVAVVHEGDHLSPQMTENVAQKQAYAGLADIVVAEHAVEAQMLPPGTDRKTGDN
jgi:hypothetical protein